MAPVGAWSDGVEEVVGEGKNMGSEEEEEGGGGGGKKEGDCGEVGDIVMKEGLSAGEGRRENGGGEGEGEGGSWGGVEEADEGTSSGLRYSAIEIASEAIATTLLPTSPAVFMQAFTMVLAVYRLPLLVARPAFC